MIDRHLALANQPPQAPVFSLRLADQGALSTSSLHLSLLEARVFAWRTRVISSQGGNLLLFHNRVVEYCRNILLEKLEY